MRHWHTGAKLMHGDGFAREELGIPAELLPGDYVLEGEVTEDMPGGGGVTEPRIPEYTAHVNL
jgi:hypothetical protein